MIAVTPHINGYAVRETETPAYRHVGGSIVYRNVWLDDAEVERQLALAEREAEACKRINEMDGYRAARTVFLEITDAINAQAAWKRCASASRQSSLRAA